MAWGSEILQARRPAKMLEEKRRQKSAMSDGEAGKKELPRIAVERDAECRR
jgi:hypothetical protein